MCATEPERAAQRLVDAGLTGRYDYALHALKELSYDTWRQFDPEDSPRLYALRFREVDMIKSKAQPAHCRAHRTGASSTSSSAN
jgi:NitT/TauT family transport system substrate-binding protein